MQIYKRKGMPPQATQHKSDRITKKRTSEDILFLNFLRNRYQAFFTIWLSFVKELSTVINKSLKIDL